MRTRVVGLFYRPASARVAVEELRPGDLVTLEREPDNPHDAYAIKVLSGSVHIGYIPRELAAYLEELPTKARFVEIEEERAIYPVIEWDDQEAA